MIVQILILLILPLLINVAVKDYIPCGHCRDDDFICGTGECIRKEYVCNELADCIDSSDEMNCSRLFL